MILFVDSGAWIALNNRLDTWHELMKPHWSKVLKDKVPLYTSSLVLLEACAHMQNDANTYKYAHEFLRRLILETGAQTTIIRPDVNQDVAALSVWGELGRFGLDWTDAVTVHLARKLNATVFGTNPEHFTAAGLPVLPSADDLGL